jgi:type VI secretion system protein ImpA
MPIDIEALLQPISEAQPCGSDLRNHPIYIQIREARRQEESLSQGVWAHDVKEADYALALKLSKEALTKRGKDLQVAAWMTEALVRQEGFAGLGQGLELISRLLDRYWDSVHPQMEEDGDLEMRATPLRWTGSQLDNAIRSVPLTKAKHNWYQYKQSRSIPTDEASKYDDVKGRARQDAIKDGQTTPEDFGKGFESTPLAFVTQVYDSIGGLLERVQALTEFCDEKFGDESPDFSPLRNTLEDVHTTVRVFFKQKGGKDAAELEAEQEAAEAVAEEVEEPAVFSEPQATFVEQQAAAPRRAASGGGIEPSSPEDAVDRLLAAARYLRKANPQGSGGYLIPRMLRWGELRATGGFPDPAVLAAPPSELRISLKRLASEGQWEQVGDLAETAAGQPCGRAWLDLQRYACNAAQFTGASEVMDAILAGLKSLLADLPQLLAWTLADDTPVANPETMAWMKERGVLKSPEPEPPPAPVAPPVQQEWYPPPEPVRASASHDGETAEPAPPDAYELAMQAAQSGNIEGALEILSRELAQEPCGRDRFLRKLQVAKLCVATGNQAVAEPVLKELAAEIDRRNLMEWEVAEVVAEPLALLYRCLDSAPEVAAEKRELYARICRLNPARAVRLPR